MEQTLYVEIEVNQPSASQPLHQANLNRNTDVEY